MRDICRGFAELVVETFYQTSQINVNKANCFHIAPNWKTRYNFHRRKSAASIFFINIRCNILQLF
jgi:hypothetical protein